MFKVFWSELVLLVYSHNSWNIFTIIQNDHVFNTISNVSSYVYQLFSRLMWYYMKQYWLKYCIFGGREWNYAPQDSCVYMALRMIHKFVHSFAARTTLYNHAWFECSQIAIDHLSSIWTCSGLFSKILDKIANKFRSGNSLSICFQLFVCQELTTMRTMSPIIKECWIYSLFTIINMISTRTRFPFNADLLKWIHAQWKHSSLFTLR